VPDSKYKNCSYPSNPFIRFSFLVLIVFFENTTAEDDDVFPVIFPILLT
jgi:hypothetical protein